MQRLRFAVLVAIFLSSCASERDTAFTVRSLTLQHDDRVASGAYHTCVIGEGGLVSCWGANHHGQLGLGDNNQRTVPTPIQGLEPVVALDAGNEHTCAITNTGRVACWGRNNLGQLGDGTLVSRNTPTFVGAFDGGGGATSISTGLFHTCAVAQIQGAVSCWGYNGNGQLGDGSVSNRTLPQLVRTSVTTYLTGGVKVAAGSYHSCAIANNQVHCWGYGGQGQIGNGQFPSTQLYAAATSPLWITPTDIAAGIYHTCVSGQGWWGSQARCWGRNNRGQLSSTTSTASQAYPQFVFLQGSSVLLNNAAGVTANGDHSCFRTTTNEQWCTGKNADGQLGLGATSASEFYARKVLLSGITSQDAGMRHTCSWTSSGVLYCFGYNGWGQLGENNPTSTPFPTPGFVDWDSDGVENRVDNCQWDANPSQTDTNGDGQGDACECNGVTCTVSTSCHAPGTCQPSNGTCTTETVLPECESPPEWPSGAALIATDITETTLTLTWPAADAAPASVAPVETYEIYRDGVLIGSTNTSTVTYGVSGLTQGTYYTFAVKALNAIGLSGEGPSVIVQTVSSAPPIATGPPLSSGGVTTPGTALGHLYTPSGNPLDPPPVQTGVDPVDIDPKRMSLIRGLVKFAATGNAAENVTITVAGHSEFGQTKTQADGTFSMVVNGGHSVVLEYRLNGDPDHFPVQRRVRVGWGDYVWAPDVAMTPVPTLAPGTESQYELPMGGVGTLQMFSGETVTQGGTRTARLMVPANTTAVVEREDGTLVNVETGVLKMRIAEYTVGPNGPAAMPAGIPEGIGYTYAAAITALEALDADAHIRFSQPVSVFIDNFLGFGTGTPVPVGYYDSTKRQWVPSASGRVITIVAYDANGVAEVDTDDIPGADNDGLTYDERFQLGVTYPGAIGKSLWWFQTDHLSDWDCNWALWPPNGALPPDFNPEDFIKTESDKDCEQSGSVIECENQSLGESISIAGSPVGLNYQSLRAPGRATSRRLTIPLVGAAPPPNCAGVVVDIQIAGRRWQSPHSCVADTSITFPWDGYDFAGRRMQGAQKAKIKIGYRYDGVDYANTDNFGGLGSGSSDIDADRASGTFVFSSEYEVFIGGLVIDPDNSVGGWTIDGHHRYDPLTGVIHFGDGTRRYAGAHKIEAVATSNKSSSSDTGSIALRADGTLFMAGGYGISKLGSNTAISNITGSTPSSECLGDGQPALDHDVGGPRRVRVAANGDVLFLVNGVIRRIDSEGKLSTVLQRTGGACDSDIEIPGTAIEDFDIDENDMMIALVVNGGITKAHIINMKGSSTPSGTQLTPELNGCHDVANGHGGVFYVSCGERIRELKKQLQADSSQPQVELSRDYVTGLTSLARRPMVMGATGLYYVDVTKVDYTSRYQIRVGPEAKLVVGHLDTPPATAGNGGHPLLASFERIWDLAIHPDGALFILDNNRVRSVRARSQQGEGLTFPSADGAALYVFDNEYKHVKTIDAIGGADLITFTYDSKDRLETITDQHGNTMTVRRNASGEPYEIEAPFGQKTTLTVDAEGYIKTVKNPVLDEVTLQHTTSGLLVKLTDAKLYEHDYQYDGVGRLLVDDMPVGKKTLARSGGNDVSQMTLTTEMGRTTTYDFSRLDPGQSGECPFGAPTCQKRTVTQPNLLMSTQYVTPDGSQQALMPDGRRVSSRMSPDPRFGNDSPYASSLKIERPKAGGGFEVVSEIIKTRVVELTNENDLTSVEKLTETSSISDGVAPGRTVTTEYVVVSGADDRVVTTSPEGRQTTTLVNDKGQTTKSCVGGSTCTAPGVIVTDYTYDARGRVKTVVQGSRNVTYDYYSDSGYLEKVTSYVGMEGGVPKYLTTTTLRDDLGRTTELTYPDGGVLKTGYDKNGNVDSITPPGQLAHLFGFGPGNLEQAYTPPMLSTGDGIVSFAHNVDSQRNQTTRGDDSTVTVEYDPNNGRPDKVNFNGVDPDGGALTWGAIDYVYGAGAEAGRIESAVRTDPISDSQVNFGYDGPSVVSTTWTQGTFTKTVSYDRSAYLSDQEVTETVGADSVVYTFDDDDLLLSAGSMSVTNDQQFGRVKSRALGCVSDSYEYSFHGEVNEYTATCTAAPVFAASVDARDALGRIKTRTQTVGTDAPVVLKYVYDDRGRLTRVDDDNDLTVASYTYDDNGNRTSATTNTASNAASSSITIDDRDQLTSYGVYTQITYTKNGEMNTVVGPGGTTTYHHDATAQLRRVIKPNGDKIEYVLGPSGRVIVKLFNGAIQRRYVYDSSSRVVAEWDDNNVMTRFVYGTNGLAPDHMIRAGVTYAFITDHVGSPRLIVNTNDGTIAQRIDYDEFGVVDPVTLTNAGFQPFGYAAGLYDHDTGLVRFGVRSYDARFGRFITKDPSGFPDGGNRYAYAGGDPINRVDPSGLSWRSAASTAVNFAAGWLNERTWGVSNWVAGKLGLDKYIDTCSAAYRWGRYLGIAQDVRALLKLAMGFGRWAAKKAVKSCLNSFADGTMVATPSGDVPIESLGVGDLVLARSDTTGEVSWKPIKHVFHSTGKQTLQVTVSHSGVGRETIHVTDNHPLWIVGRGWVDAKDAQLGDHIFTLDGTGAVVEAIASGAAKTGVYNFEIADDHTYFAGDSRIWVHNCSRTLVAADLGLVGEKLTELSGRVLDAGTTRVITVGMIRGEITGIFGALPRAVARARAHGVKTLQIQASLADPGLNRALQRLTPRAGGTFSSFGGIDTLTFIIR